MIELNWIELNHLNAKSLGKKASGVVDYCSVIDHDFDIYAFTETWFNSDDDSKLIDLDHYSNIDCIRYGRGGGGTSMLSIRGTVSFVDQI